MQNGEIRLDIQYLKKWQKEGNKIAIFCAGRYGVRAADVLKQCGIRVDVFLDNNAERWGEDIYEGITCINPGEIAGNENYITFICINVEHYQAVLDSAKAHGIVHIGDLNDVIDDMIVNYTDVYLELIKKLEGLPGLNSFFTMHPNSWAPRAEENGISREERIAVYTGVFGNYDKVCLPKVRPDNVDYYFISDRKPEELGFFRWVDAKEVIPDRITSPIKRNRYIKMKPHLLFPQYKYSIYIDGNIEIRDDISSFIQSSKSGISSFMHPVRECLFYEAINIVNYKRVTAEDVCRQMKRYLKEGMPVRYGMPEMMVISREHGNPLCIKVMEDWWHEFDTESQRDQLSFMYAMWKNGLGITDMISLGSDSRKCERIMIKSHNRLSTLIANEEQ